MAASVSVRTVSGSSAKRCLPRGSSLTHGRGEVSTTVGHTTVPAGRPHSADERRGWRFAERCLRRAVGGAWGVAGRLDRSACWIEPGRAPYGEPGIGKTALAVRLAGEVGPSVGSRRSEAIGARCADRLCSNQPERRHRCCFTTSSVSSGVTRCCWWCRSARRRWHQAAPSPPRSPSWLVGPRPDGSVCKGWSGRSSPSTRSPSPGSRRPHSAAVILQA
jgi:hypothetical protein